jgi:hypothetical protein
MSKVISGTFHIAEWRNLTAYAEASYFFRDAETAASRHYSVCHDKRKIVLGGRKLILAIPWPA